ncbi:MAG: hypothetical protein GX442_15435 [Candidatus Riflebacteria bacterium]|nr:hypothetical protein [Candidatus Riflebacteria bacterium]
MADMNEKDPFEGFLRDRFPVKPPAESLLARLESRAAWNATPDGGPGSPSADRPGPAAGPQPVRPWAHPIMAAAAFAVALGLVLTLALWLSHSPAATPAATPGTPAPATPIPAAAPGQPAPPLPGPTTPPPPPDHIAAARPEPEDQAWSCFSTLLARREPAFAFDLGNGPAWSRSVADLL